MPAPQTVLPRPSAPAPSTRVAAATLEPPFQEPKPRRSRAGRTGLVAFSVLLIGGLIYTVTQVSHDLNASHLVGAGPYLLLGLALLIALGFEFVNGFHDTANAVATVIYTHSMEPHLAVAWSGLWNFFGVMASSGAVAFGILSLLPVDLILQVGSDSGFAMIFALLLAAIVWNLGTWWKGLPASSSHTMVGSIIGVGMANQLMSPHTGTSGVDWAQALNVFKVLLISPVVGFVVAALLLLGMRAVVRNKAMFAQSVGNQPPPTAIRALLIGTCTGVSFFHGSNDGQKGMGLIMLILIGTVPTAYSLNHAVGPTQVQDFVSISEQAAKVLDAHVAPGVAAADSQQQLLGYLRSKHSAPQVMAAERDMVTRVSFEVQQFHALDRVPASQQANVRNDLYLATETLRTLKKNGELKGLTVQEMHTLDSYQGRADRAIKYIPTWVKVAVAIALGLGTMVGWRRIVVTVGERIGKKHLTYAQGAAAELTAMGTIFAADTFGLPVSTTHVLSSGVAGTMAADGSGLEWKTVRNIAMAWVLTLPAAATLSASLYWLLRHLF